MKQAAAVCALFLAAWPMFAQSNVTNEQLLKEIQALQKEVQELKKLVSQPRAAAPDVLPKDPINISADPSKGSTAAKVAIIEYSEFQCPFCSRFFKDTYPQLAKDYVDTGKVKYVWRDLPLDFHKQAFKAAEAAHCAGEQGRFWEMHDRMFENQKNLAPEELTKYAESLQIDSGLFQKCLDSGRYAEAIRKDITEANSVGITGTPSFLVGVVQPNGTVKVTKKIVGARPYADFKAAIDAILTPPTGAGSN